LPTNLGKSCSVPMSAAMPISISLIVNWLCGGIGTHLLCSSGCRRCTQDRRRRRCRGCGCRPARALGSCGCWPGRVAAGGRRCTFLWRFGPHLDHFKLTLFPGRTEQTAGFLEIEPGSEDLAFCLQDGHSGIGHLIDASEGIADIFEEGQIHCIEGFGSRNGHLNDGAFIQLLNSQGLV
jgi:hypothetical protein